MHTARKTPNSVKKVTVVRNVRTQAAVKVVRKAEKIETPCEHTVAAKVKESARR